MAKGLKRRKRVPVAASVGKAPCPHGCGREITAQPRYLANHEKVCIKLHPERAQKRPDGRKHNRGSASRLAHTLAFKLKMADQLDFYNSLKAHPQQKIVPVYSLGATGLVGYFNRVPVSTLKNPSWKRRAVEKAIQVAKGLNRDVHSQSRKHTFKPRFVCVKCSVNIRHHGGGGQIQ